MNKSDLPKNPLGITELLLRDAHQSLLATRWRTEDMLPLCEAIDKVGYWSVECWGGATYDSCLRFLGEDPWDRLRQFREAMPNSRLQMLLRGRNLLGYKHYSQRWISYFVEQCADTGIDVFRIFDAMNDVDNINPVVEAVHKTGKHAQGTISYTVSPVHDLEYWIDLAKGIAKSPIDSLAIKDMAGLLAPYDAYELVSRLKEELDVPIHMQCHATTGLSSATYVKAIEAGIDNVDTAISSMSMTYAHSSTEAINYMYKDSPRDPQLDVDLMAGLARKSEVLRNKYRKFEGSLRGVDARIIDAGVPGGMLSNLENQLKQQQASDKFGEVLAEVPRVRQDLGYIALVTPTSQIVGTQALINVMGGERYATITQEVQNVVRGNYGRTPASVSDDLRAKVEALPAPEVPEDPETIEDLIVKLKGVLSEKLSAQQVDDRLPGGAISEQQALNYIMFPQVAEKFLLERDNPDAFELAPADIVANGDAYLVTVDGITYNVSVDASGTVSEMTALGGTAAPVANSAELTSATATAGTGEVQAASLAGTVLSVKASAGTAVASGDVVLVMEALKMEVEVKAPKAGTVAEVMVSEGEQLAIGTPMYKLG